MHVHLLGIGGSFMGGVALLARASGHQVSGSDTNVYPPMSTQLARHGIALTEGYDPAALDPAPDVVIIGNALARGNPAVEYVLDRGLAYTSGAQWVAENILPRRWVLAVCGTHGKTTTAALLAWILEHAGLEPGFLIGGVAENFGLSARLGRQPFFVIEADEYDTAFFDKRSKFVHYRPRTVVLNNLEFDHADIFPDIEAIKRQFHHLVRTVPSSGLLVVNHEDRQLAEVLEMGYWSSVELFNSWDGWHATARNPEASHFEVRFGEHSFGEAAWDLIGRHNMYNALAAIVAARHAGVLPAVALSALQSFRNVKRRLEARGVAGGITVYDDFAHHPTAIAETLAALRARVADARIIAVLEPRSNTMRMGIHRDTLGGALALADRVLLFRPSDLTWNLERVCRALNGRGQVFGAVEAILETLEQELRTGDHVLIMSNGGFEDIHTRLLERLRRATDSSG